MIKQKISNLDLNIYEETLDNGLKIYICPMDKNNTHASVVTKYGSDYLQFVPKNKNEYITIPEGTAHFLEHKMFETKDGEDPMILYSNNGAISNAYTSFNITRYYFTGVSHFYDNLKILLDCITTSYFTKENIQKEQGIITQEINTGLDNPYQRIYYLMNENIFINHPHKNSVIGTTETIAKLTPEILSDCFNTFYHPSNMYIVITGKVDPKQTIDYIKEFYQKLNFSLPHEIKLKKYDEPKCVKNKKAKEQMNITNKILSIAYKIKIDPKENKFLANLYILIYLDILFSEISELYTENHKDKNIISHINYFTEIVDDFIAIHFDTEVIKSTEILDKINQNLNKKEFSKETFSLIVKNILNSLVLATENVENMAHIIVNQELLYNKFYNDIYNIYKNIDYNKCLKFIKQLDFSNYTKCCIEK